jgi:hypothetical protein
MVDAAYSGATNGGASNGWGLWCGAVTTTPASPAGSTSTTWCWRNHSLKEPTTQPSYNHLK